VSEYQPCWRVLLVGETNPYGSSPAFALFHLPRHASGNRLREHLGLNDGHYEQIMKANLCTGKWGMRAARVEAAKLEDLQHLETIVMLGTKVKTAFGLNNLPFFRAVQILEHTYVSLPHPSGLNRLWNDPLARYQARDVLKQHVPEVPWGSTTSDT